MNIDGGLVRVGMVSFSTAVTVEFQLKSFSTRKDVFDEIDKGFLREGSTNTADALKVVHQNVFTEENGDRPNVKNIAILITDGVSIMNPRRTIHEAIGAREKGVHIYAIGIALRDKREVNAIASIPAEENAFFTDDFDYLEGLEEDILQSICDGKLFISNNF
ncbi:hypothetical protein FSP39_021982 [Pinctada imbricata]|uniref:VWFA domain-containing protein n=1 Tax=Pinctada imbricata TaxID=66713 RepID=A0AA88XF67_PINIB|nr:hypothetical protein FSP39_021982 [Pinctada imbricata]